MVIRCFDCKILPDVDIEQFKPVRIRLSAVSGEVLGAKVPCYNGGGKIIGQEHAVYFIFNNYR